MITEVLQFDASVPMRGKMMPRLRVRVIPKSTDAGKDAPPTGLGHSKISRCGERCPAYGFGSFQNQPMRGKMPRLRVRVIPKSADAGKDAPPTGLKKKLGFSSLFAILLLLVTGFGSRSTPATGLIRIAIRFDPRTDQVAAVASTVRLIFITALVYPSHAVSTTLIATTQGSTAPAASHRVIPTLPGLDFLDVRTAFGFGHVGSRSP